MHHNNVMFHIKQSNEMLHLQHTLIYILFIYQVFKKKPPEITPKNGRFK